MLTKEEIQHIAKLARLGLKEEELEKYRNDLSLILDYMEQLKEVDIKNVQPTSHPLNLENITREDLAVPENNERAAKLVELAPSKDQGYIKTKTILKNQSEQ